MSTTTTIGLCSTPQGANPPKSPAMSDDAAACVSKGRPFDRPNQRCRPQLPEPSMIEVENGTYSAATVSRSLCPHSSSPYSPHPPPHPPPSTPIFLADSRDQNVLIGAANRRFPLFLDQKKNQSDGGNACLPRTRSGRRCDAPSLPLVYNECGGQNFDAPTQGICSNFSVLNDDPDLALGNNDVEGGSGDRGTGKKHVCRGGENGGGTNKGGNDRGVDSRVVSLWERFIHASGVVFYSLNFTQLTVPLVTSATKGTRQREKKEELPLEQDGPGFQEKGPSAVQFPPLQLFKSQSTNNSGVFLNRSFVFFLLLLSLALDPAAGVLSINSGDDCTLTDGNTCVTSGNYGCNSPNNQCYANNGQCTVSTNVAGTMNVLDFDVEAGGATCDNVDFMTVKGTKYCGTTGPNNVQLDADETFSWKSDQALAAKGFKICVVSLCGSANGQAENAATCQCGSSSCSSTTGFFCLSALNRCSKSAMAAPCSVTNGLSVNSAACSCGTGDCNATTGLFCDSSLNTCADVAPCGTTNGASENANACQCGTSKCDTSTGKYCWGSTNKCGNVGCANTDGLAVNAKACTCGTSDCSTSNGLFCHASTNQCSTEASCYIVNGNFFIVVIFSSFNSMNAVARYKCFIDISFSPLIQVLP